uniref:Uncharacterized protein n=1 Tax=Lynx canadensis TaxID=61383 RepID=A0A667HXL7_LYNCA
MNFCLVILLKYQKKISSSTKIKLQMEFKAVQRVQRLPFPPSSNLSLDTLRGNDQTIAFEHILNEPSQSELMGEPHLMVECKLGLP